MPVHDIIKEQDELKSFEKRFFLSPKKWERIGDIIDFDWKSYPFDKNHANFIPESQGIYSFVINPKFTDHPQRYLCYIGKTERTLRERYFEYLTEAKRARGRPKLIHLLNKWEGYLEFCYIIKENGDLLNLEKRLLDAFIPPCNARFSAEVNRSVSAF